ncbi:hypothetical protein AAE478_006175 [Parahypoxylon ruwenzoriense]
MLTPDLEPSRRFSHYFICSCCEEERGNEPPYTHYGHHRDSFDVNRERRLRREEEKRMNGWDDTQTTGAHRAFKSLRRLSPLKKRHQNNPRSILVDNEPEMPEILGFSRREKPKPKRRESKHAHFDDDNGHPGEVSTCYTGV